MMKVKKILMGGSKNSDSHTHTHTHTHTRGGSDVTKETRDWSKVAINQGMSQSSEARR